MNTVSGVIGFVQTGKSVLIKKTKLSEFCLTLTDSVWRVGLDPASRYTGIALRDELNKYVVLLDIKRDRNLPKDMYFDEIYYMLRKLFHQKRVSLVVNEKPFTAGFSRASDVLIALRGKIDGWVKSIPELSTAEYQYIYPQTWKSKIIIKSKGKSRFNVPISVAEDLVDVYPCLKDYLESYRDGDYDSFNALGVLDGYLKYTYTADGQRKIAGMRENSHISLVGYKWVDISEFNADYILNLFGDTFKAFSPLMLVYNTDYTLVENAVIASSNYADRAVITVVPEKELQQFQWKFGIDISQPNHLLLMFIFRKGNFTSSALNWVKSTFPWNEEVSGN